ncbi:MAG: Hsp20/alpha crystallin family protein [Armatimonadota bacterium]|nr:Hsp20/alpha crystallin family protein [Armatimonadota bacterium]
MYRVQDDVFDELGREMRKLSDEALLQMFRLPGMTQEAWAPRVDVYETDNELVIKVCAAGLKPHDIDISLSGDNKHLAIRGRRGEDYAQKSVRRRYYQLEIYYGPFERIVHLPADVPIDRDQLRATYKDGFLLIVMPKLKDDQSTIVKNIPITE